MKKIFLEKAGKYTLVSDADFKKLNILLSSINTKNGKKRRFWLHKSSGYVATKFKEKFTVMHRLILSPPAGFDVDHRNGDKLDNRRCNLRIAKKEQNAANVGINKKNTSGFKGVSLHKHNKRFVAYIGKKPRVYLGSFGTPEEAAREYNIAAKKRFGKFARLNKIPLDQLAKR
jgi:hypothetical protein